jgi:hypothetical protein
LLLESYENCGKLLGSKLIADTALALSLAKDIAALDDVFGKIAGEHLAVTISAAPTPTPAAGAVSFLGWTPFGGATATLTSASSFELAFDGTYWGGATYPFAGCDYTFSAGARLISGDGFGLAVRAALDADGQPHSGPAFQYDPGAGGYRFTEYPDSEGGVVIAAATDTNWHTLAISVHGQSYVDYLDGQAVHSGATSAACAGGVLLRTWRSGVEFRNLAVVPG